MLRRSILMLGAAIVAACTPSLGTFDALVPRDRGWRQVETDAAFGADPRQKIDVYAPAVSSSPAPVVVFIYGGSWSSGDKDDYGFLGAAFAAQGFVTAIPNYRLVPSVRFPTFVEDCAAAVRWVHDNAARLGGDPTRIVLVGHSAGAYNAISLALDAHYLHDAGVDARVIRGAAGLAGPYNFYPFDVDATRNAFGQAPDPQLTQPVHFARADAPPLLLLWGDRDTTVGPQNLSGLERAMRTAGGAVETKIYPRVDHVGIMLAISRPFRGRAPVLEDVTAFVRRVTA